MPIAIVCTCGQKLKAGDKLAGKTVKCPKCQQPLSIPNLLPEPDIDLGSGSLLSGELDELMQQSPSQASASPFAARPSGANPFSQPLQTFAPPSSDAFPKWMLWAGGGITVVLLLGLGIAMAVTALSASQQAGTIAQSADAGSAPLASDEVPNDNVASAFNEPVRDQPPSAPAESESSGSRVSAAEGSGGLTAADELASEANERLDDVAAGTDELAEATLRTIRAQIQSETPHASVALNIDRKIEAGLRQALDAMQEAYRREVQTLFVKIVDQPRFAETVATTAAKESTASKSDIRMFKNQLSNQPILANALLKNRAALRFDSYEIRRVELSPNLKTAAVIVRTMDDRAHTSQKFRFWLCLHDDGWKFFDFEGLTSGMRSSHNVAMLVGTEAELKASMPELNALQQATAAERSGSYDRLGQALDRLDRVAKKKLSHYARHYYRSQWHFSVGEFEKGLTEAEMAHAANPRSPELFLLRALANNGLGNFATAIELCKAYEKRLGRDEYYWLALGEALDGLGHSEDAVAAWERGMEYNSQLEGLLYSLALAYSPDDLDKMVPHIRPDKLHQNAFQVLIDSLDTEDLAATRDFLLAARKRK